MILALLATLGATVVAFVLYPVFSEAAAGASQTFRPVDVALSDLLDKKAMLFESIQDLDFEKAAGKVSDADYESARNDYLAQVATVLAKLDALGASEPTTQPDPTSPAPASTKKTQRPGEPAIESSAKDAAQLVCASCGENNPDGSKFCLECGNALASACATCGESLPAKARFCNACGEKVHA